MTKVGPNNFNEVQSGIYYQEKTYNGVRVHVLRVSLYKHIINVKPIVSQETTIIDGKTAYRYQPLTELALQNEVDAAVNAGFFNPTREYGYFEETVLTDGQVLNFRPDRAVLAWNNDDVKIGVYPSFDRIPYKDNAIGGGPIFVREGEYNFDPENEAFTQAVKEERQFKKNARTVIGLDERNRELTILVAEGDDEIDFGLTTEEIADILIEDFDVYDAMMLDGGGSSSLVIENELINNPNFGEGERNILSGIGIVSVEY